MKTAILFGATGLVGSELLRRIPDDPHYEKLLVFVRKKFKARHLNVQVHEVNFDDPDSFAHLVKGDECFCALGTTMRKARSKEAFRKVDFELVVKIAEIASSNNVKKFLVVSSVGANPSSKNFYLRTKGEMEKEVQKFPFPETIIVRPSFLLGKRREFRLGEMVGIGFARILNPLMIGPLKDYKPIRVKMLAKAILNLANSANDKSVFSSPELMQLGKMF